MNDDLNCTCGHEKIAHHAVSGRCTAYYTDTDDPCHCTKYDEGSWHPSHKPFSPPRVGARDVCAACGVRDGLGSDEPCAGVNPATLIANRYFESYLEHSKIESELDDAILLAFGADPQNTDTWPCGDMVYDYYDSSFELWGVKPDWTPTAEQLQAAWALGFQCCWICYTDNTERAASKNYPLTDKRQGTRGAESDYRIRLKRALARVAELEKLTLNSVMKLQHDCDCGMDCTHRSHYPSLTDAEYAEVQRSSAFGTEPGEPGPSGA